MGNSTGGGATPYSGSTPYGAAAPPEVSPDTAAKTGKGGFRKGGNWDEQGTLAQVATAPTYGGGGGGRNLGGYGGGGYYGTAPDVPVEPDAPAWAPWKAYDSNDSLYKGITDPAEKWQARQDDMNAYYRNQWEGAYGADSGFKEFELTPEWWAMDPNVRRGVRDEWYRRQYNQAAPEGVGEGYFARYNPNQFAGGDFASEGDEYKAKINSMRDFYMQQYEQKYGNTDNFQVFNRAGAGFYDMPMEARKDLLAQFYQRQFAGNMGRYGQYGMDYNPHTINMADPNPTGLANPMFDQQV